MGTLLKQTELILQACVDLDEHEPRKLDFLKIISEIRTSVADGFRIESSQIDDFINMACYLSENSAKQRDRIIGLMEAFERQQNIHIVTSINEPKRECCSYPPNVLGV